VHAAVFTPDEVFYDGDDGAVALAGQGIFHRLKAHDLKSSL
jgi:hypothetical protein